MEDKWRIWDKEIEIDEDIFDEIEEAERRLEKEMVKMDPVFLLLIE